MTKYSSFFILTVFIVYSRQACNNNCQNLGVCVENKCYCNDGTIGGDCSNLKCPTGKEYGGDKIKECSGRGKCVKGRCQCLSGFSGISCENFNCPIRNSKLCGGHGQCLPLNDQWKEDDLDSKSKELKSRIYGCVCGSGYSGYDCSFKECTLGRYDKNALNDDNDEINGQKRFKDYARDIFKPQKIDNADNCTITIENCDRDNQYHCQRRTVLIDYKDTTKRIKNRIVGSGLLTDLIVTYIGTNADPEYGFENDYTTFGDAATTGNTYSVEFYYVFDPFAKIIKDPTPSPPATPSTSCIDFTTPPQYTEAGKSTDDPVNPKYRKCSGIGDCSEIGTCTCLVQGDNYYDFDTLGFGSKQKQLYNCIPKKTENNDPMKLYIDSLEIADGKMMKGDNNPFSYLNCPESKDGARCSEQTCANYHGYSWFNYPSKYGTKGNEIDKYLPPVLCSGQGVCDSAEQNGKGICLCNEGFSGSTCQILDCPAKYCNGHGVCKYHSFEKLGLTVGECECDVGYSGYDCSERTCPKSLDGSVTIKYKFTLIGTLSGGITMTNTVDNTKYKEWTDATIVTVGDLITELEMFGKFTYTLSGNTPDSLTKESKISEITTSTTLTLSGITVEDSKKFPSFVLKDSTPNTLTATATKSNGFTISISGGNWADITGELTMKISTKELYKWSDATKVTVGDLLERIELFTHLELRCDKDNALLLKDLTTNNIFTIEGTTLTNPPEKTTDLKDITLTDSTTTTAISMTINKPTPDIPLSWSECSGNGNCDKNKGQCNCFTNYYGKYCNNYSRY